MNIKKRNVVTAIILSIVTFGAAANAGSLTSALNNAASKVSSAEQNAAKAKQDAIKIRDLMKKFDTVLGVLPDKKTRELSPEEQDIINRRQEARLAKDWATADALKADLLARGIEVKDTPQGPQIRFV